MKYTMSEGHMTTVRYIDRMLTAVVDEARADARIVAILGPRQAGKSTLVRELAHTGHRDRYVTLDDEVLLARAVEDPGGFLADNVPPLIIDEVQRAPGLMLALKRRVDVDTTPGQYLITGSANLLALASISDALPGRVDYLHLWPLAQCEVESASSAFLDRAFSNSIPDIFAAAEGRHAYADRIAAGGYPDALTRTGSGRARLFDGLIRSTLGRDVRDVWSGDGALTEQVLAHVAARSAGLMNHASLGRDVGISGKTLKAHVSALEQLFLVRRHRAWSANIDRRLVRMPKAYVADSGLLCHLLGADSRRIIDDDDIAGRTFETFVAMELVRLAAASGTSDIAFHHYRDAHRHEIDIVLERRGGDIVAIEVKASATVRSGDFSTIRQLQAAVGSRFRCGIVLYAGSRTHRFGHDLHAVPISALWTVTHSE